jgi:hypothetical protein
LPADVKAAQSTIGQQGLDLVGHAQMGVCHSPAMPQQASQQAKPIQGRRTQKRTLSENWLPK